MFGDDSEELIDIIIKLLEIYSIEELLENMDLTPERAIRIIVQSGEASLPLLNSL